MYLNLKATFPALVIQILIAANHSKCAAVTLRVQTYPVTYLEMSRYPISSRL